MNEQQKQKKLMIKYSKRERDFLIHYPHPADGSFISTLIKPWQIIHPTSLAKNGWESSGYKIIKHYDGALGSYSLLEMDWLKQLNKRGYDLTTLKFEIKMKQEQRSE